MKSSKAILGRRTDVGKDFEKEKYKIFKRTIFAIIGDRSEL